MTLDHTNAADARSWLASADPAAIPIQTLPYGAFTTPDGADVRLGVGISDQILDLRALGKTGVLSDLPAGTTEAVGAPSLNALLALSPSHWGALRHRLFTLLVDDAQGDRRARSRVRSCLVPMGTARMHLPISVGDYTDFYASVHHATNVGTMLRPEQPLFPNYRHLPVGYHGRASSVVVSGTPISRPAGQTLPAGADAPGFGPAGRLDYELEVGLVIGGENALGAPVPIGEALGRVFGLVLLNDWSARDIQAWEYQPLGPFLAKSFATTISAWVVPLAALAARRCAPSPRPADAPRPLPYLLDEEDGRSGAIDLDLQVHLSSARMREEGVAPMVVSRSNLRDLYWTPAQLVAHHTSNGCNLRPGDLLGTGTVSGPTPESRGCLLERTWRGTEPLTLPTGEQRRFLEDGDCVALSSLPGMTCVGEVRACPST